MAETLPSNRSVQTGANPSTQPESTVSAPGGLLGHAAATLGSVAWMMSPRRTASSMKARTWGSRSVS